MRVLFLGTPEFAIPSLEALQRIHQVLAVFTQPDRPAGRGQQPQPPAVKSAAERKGIPVFQPEKIRNPENQAVLESFRPDCIVVAAYGQILPAWLLQIPRLGSVNVHASLLPKYRGAAPIQWALLNGDPITGITTMLMDENLDTGPMLLKRQVEIPPAMNAGQLSARLAEVGAELLIPTLAGLESGELRPISQDDSMASLAPRITKEMARISWEQDAWSIHNRIRALNPAPLTWTDWKGNRIQILRSAPPDASRVQGYAPGTFWGAAGSAMKVVCGEGSVLEVLELQPAGRKKISGREYANGARLKAGEQLRSVVKESGVRGQESE
jgi:methionyl-tRNA formyltransferase